MQINVDKKTGLLLGIIAVLLVLLGIFLFRGSDSDMGARDMGGIMENQSSSASMNSSDIMFSQMMIAHHEQAVTMSDLALENSTNKEVLTLAAEIKAAQSPEIVLMKSWLDGAGAEYVMGHGMGTGGMSTDSMNGMLSDDEISVLKSAKGSAFDKLFLEAMIAHHEGAIQMTEMVEKSNNSEIKALRSAILKTQSAEISQMKAMLNSL